MFFTVSKLFWFVAEPISLLLLIGLLGIVLSLTRWVQLGRALAFLSILLLAVCSFSPLGAVLIRPLEDRFPQPPAEMAAPSGIIVLGGALDEGVSEARGTPTISASAARLTSAVALARRFPQAKLVFSGGSASLTERDHSEDKGVRDLWLSLGVPAAQMMFEGKSRNTYENAIFTRDLVKPSPGETWLLVTSAWHMPRAMGIFRKVGFPVTPYPVDYLSYGNARDFAPSPSVLDHLTMLNFALHEWIGLVAYRLTGKTDAWFPGP